MHQAETLLKPEVLVMHYNIADNTLGLMIKGNNQIIAYNTVLNTISNRNDIIILAEDCSNTNTWLYNNLAERIGSYRSATFSIPNNGPIPIGTDGYINMGTSASPNWELRLRRWFFISWNRDGEFNCKHGRFKCI